MESGDNNGNDGYNNVLEDAVHVHSTSGQQYTRLVLVEQSLVYPTPALLRALGPGVLLATFVAGTPAADVVKQLSLKTKFTSAALWTSHARAKTVEIADDAEEEEDGESAKQTPKMKRASTLELSGEAFKAKQRQVWNTTKEFVTALGPAVIAEGRIHVLTPNVLDVDLPEGADAATREAHEAEYLTQLEKAAGRSVVVAVGLAVQEAVGALSCTSLSRELVDPVPVYFNKSALKEWVFAHNQFRRNSQLGYNPNANTVAGIEDAADVKQTIMTYLQEFPWMYSIMVSSFLTLFVPDVCVAYRHDCSSKETLGTHTSAGQYVFAINVITAAVFFFSNIAFNRREMWLIEWLDADDELPTNNLTSVIEKYPKIKKELINQNKRCYTASLLTLFFLLLNFISSCVLLLHRALHAKVCCLGIVPQAVKTVTTLVTSVLLVMVKLLRHLRTTRRSLINNLGVSSAHLLPLSYNTIDHDHVDDDQEEG